MISYLIHAFWVHLGFLHVREEALNQLQCQLPYVGLDESFSFRYILLKHTLQGVRRQEHDCLPICPSMGAPHGAWVSLCLSPVSPNVPKGFPLNYTSGCL